MAVNKVILIGNLGSDAEVRNVGQSTVASFRLATTEKFKGQDGNLREETEWHTCELWNNSGVYQYLKKGTQVYVEGSIKTENWTDQQGQNRSRIKIRVFNLQLVGSRPQQAAPAPQGYAPQPQPQYQQRTYQPQPAAAPAPTPQYQPQQAALGYTPQPQAPAPYAMPGAAPGSDLP